MNGLIYVFAEPDSYNHLDNTKQLWSTSRDFCTREWTKGIGVNIAIRAIGNGTTLARHIHSKFVRSRNIKLNSDSDDVSSSNSLWSKNRCEYL